MLLGLLNPGRSGAEELPASVRTRCDPAGAGGVGQRPERVFTAPGITFDVADSSTRTLIWNEHDSTPSSVQDLYLSRFSGGIGSRSCAVETEASLGLPSASDLGSPDGQEGVSGAVVLRPGPTPSALILAYDGVLSEYDIAPNGWPSCPGGAADCPLTDTTTEGDGVEGPDTSMLYDDQLQVLVWGSKCNREITACEGVETAWGRVNVWEGVHPYAELVQVPVHAWVSAPPVGLSHDARSGSELLFVLGTEVSTNWVDPSDHGLGATAPVCVEGGASVPPPIEGARDCELIAYAWDGSSLVETSSWDEVATEGWDDTCCLAAPDDPALANGWVGEVVPLDGDHFVAARRHGELYRFEYGAVTGAMTRQSRITWEHGGVTYVQAPEHGMVLGAYPFDPSQRRLFVTLQTTPEHPSKDAVVLALDPDAWPCAGLGADCVLDPLDYAIAEIDGTPVWGSGAAARWVNRRPSPDPTFNELGYVLPTGTITNPELTPPTSAACRNGDVPPRVNIFHHKAPDSSWAHTWIDLVDPANPACFEQEGTQWVEIDIVAAMTIAGTAAYTATSDGVFWEIETRIPMNEAGTFLAGYQGPWPRYRKNNRAPAVTW